MLLVQEIGEKFDLFLGAKYKNVDDSSQEVNRLFCFCCYGYRPKHFNHLLIICDHPSPVTLFRPHIHVYFVILSHRSGFASCFSSDDHSPNLHRPVQEKKHRTTNTCIFPSVSARTHCASSPQIARRGGAASVRHG